MEWNRVKVAVHVTQQVRRCVVPHMLLQLRALALMQQVNCVHQNWAGLDAGCRKSIILKEVLKLEKIICVLLKRWGMWMLQSLLDVLLNFGQQMLVFLLNAGMLRSCIMHVTEFEIGVS